MSSALISLKQLEKEFTVEGISHNVIRNLDFELEETAFVCILGYTGCGKSTLLRMICGLEQPNKGQILIRGKSHTCPTKNVAMVFQDSNQLLPWRTAEGNIIFAIRKSHKNVTKQEAKEKAIALLKEVGLEENAAYYPHQLSGGMRQRIAVARALAMEPDILLMDEPFSALDENTRRKLQVLCRTIYTERNLVFLFVTHSIEEAITLSDKIVIMNNEDGSIGSVLNNEFQVNSKNEIREKMRTLILKELNKQ